MEQNPNESQQIEVSPGERARRTLMTVLSTGLTLIDLGLLYGAYTQGRYDAVALTATGGVIGVLSIMSHFRGVDEAAQLGSTESPEQLSQKRPTVITREKDTLGEHIGGKDPKRFEKDRDA